MEVKVIGGGHQFDHGPYQVGIEVVLSDGKVTQDVPRWLAEEISRAAGGNGEVDLIDSGTAEENDRNPTDSGTSRHPYTVWMIDLPAPFNGELEFTFRVGVETPA